jgi:hypothetical protein
MRTIVAVIGVLAVGCGSSGRPGFDSALDGGSSGGGGASGAPGSSSTLGGDASAGPKSCDPNAGDLAGCGCTAPDQTRPCSSLDANKRNRNGCKDGTQTCKKVGEFASWGACTGEVTSCPDFWDSGPPPCQCYAGTTRWCDAPTSCNWGKQQCKPDGTWGPCTETQDRPSGCGFIPPFNFPDPTYDEDCCVKQGQCCQDYNGPDPSKSTGKCDQVACPGDIVR